MPRRGVLSERAGRSVSLLLRPHHVGGVSASLCSQVVRDKLRQVMHRPLGRLWVWWCADLPGRGSRSIPLCRLEAPSAGAPRFVFVHTLMSRAKTVREGNVSQTWGGQDLPTFVIRSSRPSEYYAAGGSRQMIASSAPGIRTAASPASILP